MSERDDDKPAPKGKKTLSDDQIKTRPKLGRRSLLGAAAGLAGAAALGTPRSADAQVTDSDGGQCADPAGRGRGATGVTDNDGGQYADPVGNGRFSGLTDSDGGSCADPAGQGRGRPASGGGGGRTSGGPTDSDSGAYADPAGQGRGGVRTGLTDSDSGQWADMPGGGRWGSGLTDSDQGPAIRDQAGNGRRGY
jgi:hypothetical protein